MTRTKFMVASVITLLAVGLVGCQQPETDLSEMMKAPPRPAELDQLDVLVGTWEGTAELKMAGSDEVMTSQGIETVSWEADKWLLVSRYEYQMGDEGVMKGLSVMTWDPKAKKYCSWGFDNYGYRGTATMTYDAATKTWHFKGKSANPLTGEKSIGKGSSVMIDDNTQEWSWTERDSWGLKTLMEIKGTSRRK